MFISGLWLSPLHTSLISSQYTFNDGPVISKQNRKKKNLLRLINKLNKTTPRPPPQLTVVELHYILNSPVFKNNHDSPASPSGYAAIVINYLTLPPRRINPVFFSFLNINWKVLISFFKKASIL